MRDTLRLGLNALLYGVIALGANSVAAESLSGDQRAALMEKFMPRELTTGNCGRAL